MVKFRAMELVDKALPADVQELTEMVLQLRQEVAQQASKLAHQSDFIKQLIETIQLARHQRFGPSSEKLNTDQLSLLFNEAEALTDHAAENKDPIDEETDSTTVVKSYTRKKGGRKKLPDHYPRIEVIHTLEGDECQCDHCGGELAVMGEKASEQIDLIPMTVQVIHHIRKTYHCPNCKTGVKSAKLPPQPIPHSMASPRHIGAYQRQ